MANDTENKAKGFFGRLGGLLGDDTPDYIKNAANNVSDETGAVVVTQQPSQLIKDIINSVSEQTTINNNMSTTSLNTKETDARYEEQIRKSLREANQPGPDYYEFSEAVRKMQKVNPSMLLDDVIKNAYIVLSANGLTKARILETGKVYQGVLHTERSKFEHAILQGSKQKIDVPQDEIEQIKKDNLSLEKQLKELQNQINANNTIIDSKQKEINLAKDKLSANKTKFHNTIEMIDSEMTNLLIHAEKIIE